MVRSKRFTEWSPAVRRQLRGLTFRETSGILSGLMDEPDPITFVRFVGRRVVSWGMFFDISYEPGKYIDYMTYTRRADRRKGYGKEVMQAAAAWRRTYRKGFKVNVYNASGAAACMWDRYSFYNV